MLKKVALLGLLTFSQIIADEGGKHLDFISTMDIKKNPLYEKECGACHFAYQSTLLPSKSWLKLMGDLENHFDVDASLDINDKETLIEYLTKNAGETATQKYHKKIVNSIAGYATPIKISETPYFIKKHKEIPKRLIIQIDVKSLSHCATCHKKADVGLYGERYIDIPNYGKWDD